MGEHVDVIESQSDPRILQLMSFTKVWVDKTCAVVLTAPSWQLT